MIRDEGARTKPPHRTVVMWSGGKDAAVALQALLDDAKYVVEALLTTVVEGTETVTMHGVPIDLVRAQADAVGCRLHIMRVPPSPPNETYEEQLERSLSPLLAVGITTVATGDLFLDDIRAYREDVLRRIGATPHFPVWDRDTSDLAEHVVQAGYQALVVSVDTMQLGACFVGRSYDTSFLANLPDSVDACGEDGAFHTFVTNGPPFAHAVPVRVAGQHGTGRMHYARLVRADV